MRRRVALEWAVLAGSALAIAVVVIVLALEGLTGDGRPAMPVVEVHVERGYQTQHGWVVPATVDNEGDEPAEALVLEATTTVAGSDEASEVDVDFLPAGTELEVAFAFSARPEGPISVRVVAFRVP